MSSPFLRLHIGIFLAGATGIFGRLISLTELPLVWHRMVIASVTLAAVLALSHPLRCLPWRHLLPVSLCGGLLAAHWVFFYASIKASNVSIAVVCIALDGFFTAIMEPAINRHRLSARELLLSLITLAGIMLIFGFDPRYRLGIAYGVFSSFLYCIFSICNKNIQHSSGHKSSTMLLYELITGAMFLTPILPLYAWIFPGTSLIPQGADWFLLPVFASVFTIMPFLFQLQALRHISAFTVNLSYNLEPIYSIILAMIIFNEGQELNQFFWLGVLCVIISVVLQSVASKGHHRS